MGGLFTTFFSVFQTLWAWLPSSIATMLIALVVIAFILLLLKIIAIILDAIPFL